MKVGDFGLADLEDVYTTGYFRQSKDSSIKLYSYPSSGWLLRASCRDGLFSESLRDGLFSEKSESDVVSTLLFSMYGL